jgi:hypothetical protein
MATHLPVNHRLRGLYRALAGTTGIFLVGFGIAGVLASRGKPFFHQGGTQAWGIHTDTAFAVLSIVVGLVILVGVAIGRNVDRFINMVGAIVFMVAGLIMLPVLRTNANILNYDVTAACVSFLIGAILLLSGLYGRIGPAHQRFHEENFRCNKHPDPVMHFWMKLPPKKPRTNRRFA